MRWMFPRAPLQVQDSKRGRKVARIYVLFQAHEHSRRRRFHLVSECLD